MFHTAQLLTDDELEVEGRLYPWYVCPFGWKGVLHDPFAEQRAFYDRWRGMKDPAKMTNEERIAALQHPPADTAGFDNDDLRRMGLKDLLFVKLCDLNPAFFIHHVLKIKTKKKKVVRFNHWTRGQRKLQIAFAYQWFVKHIPVRIIILKARQVGGSTWTEAILFWLDVRFENQDVIAMAHGKLYSENMLNMVDLFLRNLQDYLPFCELPAVRTADKEEFLFDAPRREVHPEGRRRKERKEACKADEGQPEMAISGGRVLHSTYKIRTPRSKNEERSSTLSGLHGSEVAFWPDGERIWLALAQCVPYSNPHSIVVLESSANGTGDFFETRWLSSAKEDSDYIGVFTGWHELPFVWDDEQGRYTREYSRELPDRYQGTDGHVAFVVSYSDDEREMVKRLDLTPEQVYWRRRKIEEDCSGDPIRFKQEFPSTPEEAFIVGGEGVYTPEAVRYYIEKTRVAEENPVLFLGELGIVQGEHGGWEVREYAREDGPVSIYVRPEAGHSYCVSLDPSECRTNTSDEASINVFDAESLEQCANALSNRMDTDRSAYLSRCLQVLFGNAFLIPEANAIGAASIKELKALEAHPMYMREVTDSITNEPREKFGFYTSGASKKMGIQLMRDVVNRKKLKLHSYRTALQLQAYVYRDGRYCSGKPKVGDDDHDSVMLNMLGIHSPQFRWNRVPAREGMERAGDAVAKAVVARAEGRYNDIPSYLLHEGQDHRHIDDEMGECR